MADQPSDASRAEPGAPDVLDELATISLADETLDSALAKVVSVARRRVPGTDAASVTLVQDGRPRTAAFDGEVALLLDERQYDEGFGPCLDAGRGGEVLVISDMRTEQRWPRYTPGAVEAGVLSSMSFPLPVQTSVFGALNLYSHEPGSFRDDSYEVAKRVAGFVALVVRSAYSHDSLRREAEGLQRAMESRAVIEQAKGVLIAQHAIPADEAFALLVKMSQQLNVKLRDVAAAIVDDASRPDGAPER